MGPQLLSLRKSDNSASMTNMMSALQWGRNFIVAEMYAANTAYTADKGFNGAATLSLRKCDAYHAESRRMFGGFNGAATLSLRKFPAPGPTYPMGHLLQWGRNFIVAEIILPDSIPHSRPLRFNGAATLSLRKSIPRMPLPTKSSCFNGAATLSLRKYGTHGLPAPLYQASMGPQLYRCGNAEEDP